MRKLISLMAIIIIFLQMNGFCVEKDLSAVEQGLLQFALEKQDQYAEVTSLDEADDWWYDYAEMSSNLRDFFKDLKDIRPKYAIILTTNENFCRAERLKQYNIPESMFHSLNFNRMFNITKSYEGIRLAETSWETSLYDVTTIMDIPEMAYVILLYGEDTPQIVTAFSKTEGDEALTYTTFVHAEADKREGDIGYFAEVISMFWGIDAINMTIYDLEQ